MKLYSRNAERTHSTYYPGKGYFKMCDGAPKVKRNGARTFKNPPQPHMCIQDFVKGCSTPCYINVLSWDKVDKPTKPNQELPLYGAMKLHPPRTEDKNTLVFAVIANPEVLKLKGKNSKDPYDRASLINVLLDYVETRNKGIIFERNYNILKDRDITGELKDIWIAVQNQRERDSSLSQQETWIDGQPSQCTDQQQQQNQPQSQLQTSQQVSQQVQQQQQQQQQQQHIQQNQQMIQNSYMMSQPPQYPPMVFTPLPNDSVINYETYTYQQTNLGPLNQNDQNYQTNSMLVRTYNNGNGSRMDPNYRGRSLPQKPIPKQQLNNTPQPQTQQNCPAYSASQYHFQQLPRQMVPQYINSNMNPNYGSQMNSVVSNHYSDYVIMQHQHIASGLEQCQVENQIHAEVHRIQQQEQMHAPPPHIQPAPQYQHAMINNGKRSLYMDLSCDHGFIHGWSQSTGGNSKNSTGKRQNNSLSHAKQRSSTTGMCPIVKPVVDVASKSYLKMIDEKTSKPKSPVKVLQRVPILQWKQNSAQSPADKNSKSIEKNIDESNEASNVQVTDLYKEEIKALNCVAALKELKVLTENSKEAKTPTLENSVPSIESPAQELKETKQHHYNHKQRSVKIVIKRNKSCANDVKGWAMDAHKGSKNGIIPNSEQSNSHLVERLQEKDVDDHPILQPTTEVNSSAVWNIHVKPKSTDSPKRAQSTVNSIIKSVFKIHQGNNASADDIGIGKKQRANGQVKAISKVVPNEYEENNQGYTILKKSEVTAVNASEEIENEIAQLSIQDCKDTTEMNTVLS